MEHESSPCEKRVCLVMQCLSWRGETDEFKFYIVDWDSSSGSGSSGGVDEYTDMEPTFRFKSEGTSPPLVAFCVLKSTLYMFEGDDHNRRRRRNSEGWFAGKFVISEDIVSCYNLEKQDLLRINQMNQKKFSPIALPTPNGKSVLVFSSHIILKNQGYFGDSFELYNVEDDSWQLLPRLPSNISQPRPPSSYLPIIAYGFETESHFLISIATGMFVLDLNKPSAWEEQFQWGHTWLREGHFLGIDRFYFSPGWACDTRDHGLHFEYPPLSPLPVDYDSIPTHLRLHGRLFPYISLLGHKDDRVYDIGVVRAQCHPDHMEGPKNVRVILDITRTVIEKFKKDIGIYEMDIEDYQRVVKDYEFKKKYKMYKSLAVAEERGKFDYKERGEYDDEDYDDEDEEEEPDDEDEGEEPDDEDEGEEPYDEDDGEEPDDEDEGEKPDDEDEGEKPDDEAEGEKPDDEDEGEKPYPEFNSSVLDTNHTLRNTVDFIKSVKFRIDYDYDSSGCGRMYLFSI